jgi:hypothetical protein
MATFRVVGKLDFTIFVADFKIVQITANVLCALFVFWRGSLLIFKDVSYAKYNIILIFVY